MVRTYGKLTSGTDFMPYSSAEITHQHSVIDILHP